MQRGGIEAGQHWIFRLDAKIVRSAPLRSSWRAALAIRSPSASQYPNLR
ncbi:hypothetical protein [Paraburkholderia sp. CI3]